MPISAVDNLKVRIGQPLNISKKSLSSKLFQYMYVFLDISRQILPKTVPLKSYTAATDLTTNTVDSLLGKPIPLLLI